jgi:hypothetical protein
MPNDANPFVSTEPGALPGEGPLTLAGLSLPDGHRVHPDRSFLAGGAVAPVMWMTDDVVPGTAAVWSGAAHAFSSTGLWPILLDGLAGETSRPWEDGELSPEPDLNIGALDAAAVLESAWDVGDDELIEMRAPVSGEAFPGLTATEGWPDRDGWPDDIAPQLPDRKLGLVPATRPADVPAVIGWTGPANWYDSMAPFSAVLRSWEERFGAVVVEIGFDTLILAVRRPPSSIEAALRVTAEHEAFCSDNIWQGVGSYAAYAQELVDSPAWSFWWD